MSNWNPATLSSPDDCVLSPTNENVENIHTLYGYDCTVTYYDTHGRREAAQDLLGHRTEYGYDAQGRLTPTARC